MKIRDSLNRDLELLQRLSTASSIAVRQNSNNSVIATVTSGYHVKNGQCEVDWSVLSGSQPDQLILSMHLNHMMGKPLNYVGRIHGSHSFSLVSSNNAEKPLILVNNNGTVTIPSHLPLHTVVTNNISRSNIDNETSSFINNTIWKIESTLSNIQQISSYKSSKENYLNSNSQLNSSIAQEQQKAIPIVSEIKSLKEKVDNFKLKDNISERSPEHRSHILLKIWGNQDTESGSIKTAIKECGFNPNYSDKAGNSLINIALDNNDGSLFDLLIANKINFNSSIGNKTICQLVLESANESFITKMFATSEDLSKAVLDLALKDDADNLSLVFSCKPELTKTIYSDHPLLELALNNGCYKSAAQILQDNPDVIDSLTGISDTLAVARGALENKQPGIVTKLCKQDESLLLKLTQLENLDLIKELLNDQEFMKLTDKVGNSLLHIACKIGNSELAKIILTQDFNYLNNQNNLGQTALGMLIDSETDQATKAQIAHNILASHPAHITLQDLSESSPKLADCTTEFISLFEELGLIGNDNDLGINS